MLRRELSLILALVSIWARISSPFPSTRTVWTTFPGRQCKKSRHVAMCTGDQDFTDGDFTSLDDLLYSRGVMFVGDGQAEAAAERSNSVKNGAYLFAPTTSSENTNVPINGDPMNARDLSSNKRSRKKKKCIEIPLLPFEAPLFPGSREFLFIYEMRFRSLMNDVKDSKLVGRCFLSEDDQIGSVGTLCKIVESRKLESGKGFFVIEARRRFRIMSIEQRVPYSTAIVELDYEDDPVSDEQVPGIVKLWNDIYRSLKIYLRIARLHAETLKSESYDDILGDEADHALVDVRSEEIARLQREIGRIESRIKSNTSEAGDEERLVALLEAVAGFQQMTGVDYSEDDEVEDQGAVNRYLYDSDEARSEIENSMYRLGQARPSSSIKKRDTQEGADLDDAEDDVALSGTAELTDGGEELDEEMEFLSPEVRDTKPLDKALVTQMTNMDIISRVTAFSHAVANLLSTDEYVMQQLLQSTDLVYRLKGLKASLDEALEDITDAMQGTDMTAGIEEIVMKAMQDDDDDGDLMPPPEYPGVTLDAVIDEELLIELNERDTREVESTSSRDEAAGAVSINDRQYSALDSEDDADDDDIWSANSTYAFQ